MRISRNLKHGLCASTIEIRTVGCQLTRELHLAFGTNRRLPLKAFGRILCLNCLTLLTVLQASARDADVSTYVLGKLKTADVLYLGELHSVAEHKAHLKNILSSLVSRGAVQNFAFEFSRADANGVLQEYLSDPAAVAHSELEKRYFSKLHRSYEDMFNNSIYDDVMRLLRELKLRYRDRFTACAIDESSLPPDSSADGEKLRKLQKLPTKVRLEIEHRAKTTLEAIATTEGAWDREATMGVNIANCGGGTGKTLAFVGTIHASNFGRIRKAEWANAIQYTAIARGRKAGSIGLWQSIVVPSESLPFLKAECIEAQKDQTLQFVAKSQIRKNLDVCFDYSDQEAKFSFRDLYDGFVIGPPGTRIIN